MSGEAMSAELPLRRLLAGTILFAAFSAYAPSRSPATELQKELAAPALQKELIAADRGIWEAIAASPLKMDRVSAALAPDYIDVDSGIRNSRADALQYVQGLTKFSFQYGSARAYVLSPTSGYVIAELSYSSVQNGTAAAGKVLTTTVFSKEHAHWVAHLHTEMEIKPQPH